MTYYLIEAGSDSLAVMAALRSSFRISLGAANSLIANVPSELPAPHDGDIEGAVERLRRAGATVDTTTVVSRPETTAPRPSQPEPVSSSGFGFSDPKAMWNYYTPGEPVIHETDTDSDRDKYDVYLPVTSEKLRMVKAVKEATGWGWKETKEWVDEAPFGSRRFSASNAMALRDYLAAAGFEPNLVRPGENVPKIDEAPTETSAMPSVINKITITDPGAKRMQIIPLLKKELKMNYSSAAGLAESGGDITTFPDAATAARVADALRALGAVITLG